MTTVDERNAPGFVPLRAEDYPVTFPWDDAVTFTVSCAVTPDGPRTRHPVTVNPDWSVDTGHDLATERVAAALGAWPITCLVLADRTIPAVRDAWAHRARRAPVAVRPDGDAPLGDAKRWILVARPAGCACGARPNGTLTACVAHVRSPEHWAHVHHVPAARDAVERYHQICDGSTALHWPRGTEWPHGERPLGAATFPPAMRAVTPDRHDAEFLWLAGVHPDWALAVKGHLEGPESLEPLTYLYISLSQVPLDWLARFVPYGPGAILWAARSYHNFDQEHPDERLSWLQEGFAYARLGGLLGSSYRPADVRALADMMQTSPTLAAGYFGRWMAAHAEPSLEQLATVWALPHSLHSPPTLAMIGEVRRARVKVVDSWSTTEVGLAIAACGSVTAAINQLGRIAPRDLDSLLARLREEARHG